MTWVNTPVFPTVRLLHNAHTTKKRSYALAVIVALTDLIVIQWPEESVRCLHHVELYNTY